MIRFAPFLAAAVSLFIACCPASGAALAANERPTRHEPDQAKFVLVVRYGPNSSLETRLSFESRSFLAAWNRQSRKSVDVAGLEAKDVLLVVSGGRREGTYTVLATGELYDPVNRERIRLGNSAQKRLAVWANAAKAAHYGKIVPWSEADRLVPLKRIFDIVDVETGARFRAQRRAGRDHADVQPLTREDTRVMKEIYGGRWSWKRRAILVRSDAGWLAASMNGMPHGGDGIPNNGFSGHFCVHFLGSSTHRSDDPDLPHQLMVHKAGGALDAFFREASPRQLAEAFLEALNVQDAGVIRHLARHLPAERANEFVRDLENLDSVRIERRRPDPSERNRGIPGTGDRDGKPGIPHPLPVRKANWSATFDCGRTCTAKGRQRSENLPFPDGAQRAQGAVGHSRHRDGRRKAKRHPR